MPSDTKTADSLGKLVDEFMQKHDIERFVFVIGDPDSALSVQGKKGDILWCMGASEALHRDCLAQWENIPSGRNNHGCE